MKEVNSILAEIKKGTVKPIYLLCGEEPYYIDMVSQFIEKNVLAEEERGFNQMVLYGKDVTVDEIVSNAKRFPMMAEKQVIIVREAQNLSRSIDKLLPYVTNPQPSTVLVLCYKYNKFDKRKKVYKEIKKNGVCFESKKLYDNQVAAWIKNTVESRGYSINYKATVLLAEFLGTDLSKIINELDKLQVVLSKEKEITAHDIEQNIGISKDFNNFELKKALSQGNITKVTRILNYFGQNPKDNPFVLTIGQLYTFFNKVLKYHGMRDKNPKAVANELGVSPFFVDEYTSAARNYSMKKVSQIISELRILDLKSKGVGSQNISQIDLLKELLVKVT